MNQFRKNGYHRPTKFMHAMASVLIYFLCLQVTALAAYNVNDENRLNTAGSVNDISGTLNWNPSPATTSSWTGVTWSNVGGEDRASDIHVRYMSLEGDLNLSGMASLTNLDVHGNSLSGLNVNGNATLTHLDVGRNNLSSLDVSQNTELTYLKADGYYANSLDISQNTKLTYLSSTDSLLETLDVSHNPALTDLHIGNNRLTSLNLSQNIALITLDAYWNPMSHLDLSKNVALNVLNVSGCALKSLDVDSNTALTYMIASANQLSSLDVSNNTTLTHLDAGNNKLKTLHIGNHTALTVVSVYGNNLPLSQLYPLMNISNIEIEKQTNVSLAAFENKTLLPGTSYDLSGEARFDNNNTRFTVQLNGVSAIDGQDYTLINNKLIFTRRGTYSLTMENDAIYSKGHVYMFVPPLNTIYRDIDYDALGNPLAQVSTGSLDVLPAGVTLTWAGSPSTIWNMDDANRNWTYKSSPGSLIALNYLNDDEVVFDGDGTHAVTVSSTGVSPGSMTVSAAGYSFTGGAIHSSGALALNAAEPSVTAFANNLNFFDGIRVAANNTIAFNYDSNVSNTNPISGAGGLAKLGSGTLLLSGLNTYTGLTTVRSGTLELGSDLTASDGLTLHTGTAFKTGGHTHSLNGKVLTVWENATYDGNVTARGATMNFITPGDISHSILSVSGTADIDGSQVNVGVSGNTTLTPGTTLSLLKADGGLTGTVTQGNGFVLEGATVVHDVTLTTTEDELLVNVTRSEATDQSKALSEGFLGGLALNLQGADLVAGQGMGAAIRAARNMVGGDDGSGMTGFGALSGGSVRYNTGSYIDMHSMSLLAGLAYGADMSAGLLTVGAFFEYGNGSYDTHNSFSNAASVDGDGDTWYMGGGLLGRMDFQNTGPGHMYVEASGRAGKVHNDYNSSDLRDANGRKASYDTSSPYYGLHLGAGYIWNITEKASLDLHGKYFWTRLEGDSTSLSTGERVRFKDTDSQRVRAGSRFSYTVNDYISPYIGAAWEHEFDGKAKATANGRVIDAPNLKGSTGIGELGLAIKPSQTLPLSFDLGMQGYTGKREGVTGSLQIKFEF